MAKEKKNSDIINNIGSVSSVILVKESLRRGIKVNHINKYQRGLAFLELSYKKHREYILGSNIAINSVMADYVAKNKSLTKDFLVRAGINVAKGKLFDKEYDKAEVFNYAKATGYPVVVKKPDGAHGDLVFVNIKNQTMLEKVVKEIIKKNDYFLVEKMFNGEEYRILASREKFIAAVTRIPAFVCGDGIHNIKELIKIKNSDPRRGKSFSIENSLKLIKIDSLLKQNLYEQNKSLEYVPKQNEIVYLRKNSNLSTGGESVDFTDKIHPELKKVAVRAIRAIPGLAYGGIDLMTNKDISDKPSKNSYIIVEINSSPGIFMHHFPSQGKPRDVAKEIIDLLFPETKK